LYSPISSGDLRGDEDLRALVQANSAVGLLGPHFKKTAPFEQGFNGRAMVPTMGDTQDPTVNFGGLG
jgi:hypothetical protein